MFAQLKTSIRTKPVVRVAALAAGLALVAPISRASAETLTGAGATFPYPLYSKWFDTYSKATGIQINYQAIGSGGGIQQLKNGTVDFGASDAPLSYAEMQTMPGQVVHIPTVAGAVAVAYNLPGVGTGLKLTPDVLAGIFMGDIKKWNDAAIAGANPGVRLPNQAITVAHRSDGSGTSYIFTNYLKAISPTWARQVGAGKSVNWPTGVGGKGNDGVAAIVKQSPGGIGYVELAYAEHNAIPYAALRNRSGNFVLPSVASTVAAAVGASGAMQRDVRVSIVNSSGANAYPIAGFTYILFYKNPKDAGKGKILWQFLNWAVHQGQYDASKLLYAPLPRAVVRINESALRAIR